MNSQIFAIDLKILNGHEWYQRDFFLVDNNLRSVAINFLRYCLTWKVAHQLFSLNRYTFFRKEATACSLESEVEIFVIIKEARNILAFLISPISMWLVWTGCYN